MKIADYSVTDYCNNMTTELAGCKSKMFALVRMLDKIPGGAKTNVVPNIRELHMILDEIAELSDRIERLRTKQPVLWKPEQTKIENQLGHLGCRLENVMGAISPSDVWG